MRVLDYIVVNALFALSIIVSATGACADWTVETSKNMSSGGTDHYIGTEVNLHVQKAKDPYRVRMELQCVDGEMRIKFEPGIAVRPVKIRAGYRINLHFPEAVGQYAL